jgi:uncharacterized protein YjbI with pentapeptide repeats
VATQRLREKVKRSWKLWWRPIVFAVAVIAVASLCIIAGYFQDWTGFREPSASGSQVRQAKTLWDWMNLLLLPLVLAAGAAWVGWAMSKRRQEIEFDRSRESILQTYLDRMAELLLREAQLVPGHDRLKNLTRARTLTTLRQLDSERKGFVLRFLYDAMLIGQEPLVDLAQADLRRANLAEADLRVANLSRADLREANLSGADLSAANLTMADLRGADLSGADLSGADLYGAILERTNLTGANLLEAVLYKADLHGAILAPTTQIHAKWRLVWEIVTLGGTNRDLTAANLREANLCRADLTGANLTGAGLHGADLSGTKLTGTNLLRADLSGANLSGARVTQNQLGMAGSLKGTILPDGARHDTET